MDNNTEIDTGRKIKKDLREVVNCVLKVTRTGTQWRNIEEQYEAWESIYWNASPVLF